MKPLIIKKLPLNRAKEYYENNKERLLEQAKSKYRELSNKEKKHKERLLKKQISKYV